MGKIHYDLIDQGPYERAEYIGVGNVDFAWTGFTPATTSVAETPTVFAVPVAYDYAPRTAAIGFLV